MASFFLSVFFCLRANEVAGRMTTEKQTRLIPNLIESQHPRGANGSWKGRGRENYKLVNDLPIRQHGADLIVQYIHILERD